MKKLRFHEKCRYVMKKLRFHERDDIFMKSRDFMKKSRFHENEMLHENVEGCSRWTFTLKYSERTRARAREEGSKSHPRGKQWLTVYRAPQVLTLTRVLCSRPAMAE